MGPWLVTEREDEDGGEHMWELISTRFEHPPGHPIWAGRVPGVHCSEHPSHLMLLDSKRRGSGFWCRWWRSGSCVLDHLKLSKEAVQLLCLWHVWASRCDNMSSVGGDALYAMPHLAWIIVWEMDLSLPLVRCCSIPYSSHQISPASTVELLAPWSEAQSRARRSIRTWPVIQGLLCDTYALIYRTLNAKPDVGQHWLCIHFQVVMFEKITHSVFKAVL